jgi:hypothetical protein
MASVSRNAISAMAISFPGPERPAAGGGAGVCARGAEAAGAAGATARAPQLAQKAVPEFSGAPHFGHGAASDAGPRSVASGIAAALRLFPQLPQNVASVVLAVPQRGH